MGEKPSEKMLAVLAKAGKPVRLGAISAVGGLTEYQVSRSGAILVRRGLVERTDANGVPLKRRGIGYYRITDAGRKAAKSGAKVTNGPYKGRHTGRRKPPQGTLRGRLWTALRKMKKATVPELVQMACKGDERCPEKNARLYLKKLEASGHVREMPTRQPGRRKGSRGFKRYLLIKDTGPLPPEHHPVNSTVFDPNTEETINV